MKKEQRNTFNCTPCPKCKDTHRYPRNDGKTYCDDCGFTEPWDDFLKKIHNVVFISSEMGDEELEKRFRAHLMMGNRPETF